MLQEREFKFKFKKPGQWLWRTVPVVGYRTHENGRMILYRKDGSLLEIPEFVNNYMCKLGVDWVLAQKESMEQEAGQDISVRVVNK